MTIFTDSTHTLTSTTTIETIIGEDSVTFLSGDDTASDVSGQTGVTSLNQEQAEAAVSVLVENSSEFVFEYAVIRRSGGGGRNLLMDASDLITALEPYDTVTTEFSTTPVPLPASGAMLIAGLGAVGLMRRRRRVTT